MNNFPIQDRKAHRHCPTAAFSNQKLLRYAYKYVYLMTFLLKEDEFLNYDKIKRMKQEIIRPVNPSDSESIKGIKPFLTDEMIKKRIDLQNAGKAAYLVMELENEIVGFVLLKWEGKPTHPEYPDMEDLYIEESKRGLGYGQLLINECERLAKDRGFKKIGMAVNPSENPRAMEMYEELGYKHDGKEKYIDGVYNEVEDWVIDMEKGI
ncbi:MAG: GNAT family N-acetyltransferase [Candidatus Gottesmanbacteria bacterium]